MLGTRLTDTHKQDLSDLLVENKHRRAFLARPFIITSSDSLLIKHTGETHIGILEEKTATRALADVGLLERTQRSGEGLLARLVTFLGSLMYWFARNKLLVSSCVT